MKALDRGVAADVAHPHPPLAADPCRRGGLGDPVLIDLHVGKPVGDVKIGKEPAGGHQECGSTQGRTSPPRPLDISLPILHAGTADVGVDLCLAAVAALPIDHELSTAEPPGVVEGDRVGDAALATEVDRPHADPLHAVKVNDVGLDGVEHLAEAADRRGIVEAGGLVVNPLGKPHAEDTNSIHLIAVKRVRPGYTLRQRGEDADIDAVLLVQAPVDVLRDDRRSAKRPRMIENVDGQHPQRCRSAAVSRQGGHLPAGDPLGCIPPPHAGPGRLANPPPQPQIGDQPAQRRLPRIVASAEKPIDAIRDRRRERGPRRADRGQADRGGLEILDVALGIIEDVILKRGDADIALAEQAEIRLVARGGEPFDPRGVRSQDRRDGDRPDQPQPNLRKACEDPADRSRGLLEIDVVRVGAGAIHDPHQLIIDHRLPPGGDCGGDIERVLVESILDHVHLGHARPPHGLSQPRRRRDGRVAGEHGAAIKRGTFQE